MSLLLRFYAECAVLLTLGHLALWGARRLAKAAGRSSGARSWLGSAQLVVAAALVLPLATRALPDEVLPSSVFGERPLHGLWAGADPALFSVTGSVAGRAAKVAASHPISAIDWTRLFAAATALFLASSVVASVCRYLRLRRHLRALPLVRRLGRVRVCASDTTAVPYSARTVARAFVVVPTDLLADWARLRLILAHELQHHRQGDTLSVHLSEAVRHAFAWLPAAHGWSHLLSELQESACDEAVLRRWPHRAREYAGEIVRLAGQHEGKVLLPAGTAAAARRHEGTTQRRIERIMRFQQGRTTRTWWAGVVSVALLGSVALAARAHEKGAPEDSAAVREADPGSRDFGSRTNDLVREELARLRGDEKRRAHAKAGLERMGRHRATIEATLDRYWLPRALLAVPLVESGFENLAPTGPVSSLAGGPRGAGLWMFIPPTARRYGLKVDDAVDERMEVERETVAAARYLSKLYQEFRDWPLALAAYNQGEGRVREAIRIGGTRDAWKLQRDGHLNRYASTVMAAGLVIEDPSLLD